jgi:hypothetical protein
MESWSWSQALAVVEAATVWEQAWAQVEVRYRMAPAVLWAV